jgi:hypothetical protein
VWQHKNDVFDGFSHKYHVHRLVWFEQHATMEAAIARAAAPDEPKALAGPIAVLQRAHYQGRTWATRARPWVDRLASAWLNSGT